MKIIQKVIVILFITIFNQAAENTEYWHSGLPDNWEVYYEFIISDSLIKGKYVSYLNGMQFAGGKTGNTIIQNDSINMVINTTTNIVFKGKYNQDKTIINGMNYYPNGSTLNLTMKKLPAPFPNPFYPRLVNDTTLKIPKLTEDGINITTFEKAGFSKESAEKMIKKIIAGDFGEIHAVLIAKDNNLVMEEYFYDYDIDKLHRLHSCTKSIISLLYGIALGQNQCPSLDTKISDFLSEYEISSDLYKITVEDLLGMSSGLSRISVTPTSNTDWIKKILETKPEFRAGRKFRYNDNNSHLIGYLMSRSIKYPINDYAEKVLFKPLEINQYHWEYENDLPKAHTGISLTARDFMKIGIMVSNNGYWQGKEIINSDWIQKSTNPRKKAYKKYHYGLHWWSLKYGREYYPLAQGSGGQRMIIFPEDKIVCIVYGGNFNSWHPLDELLFDIIDK